MRWLLAIVAVAAVVGPAAATAAAQPADVPGWDKTRWGMSADELGDALGPALTPLAGRLDYASGYAEAAIRGTDLDGIAFDAFMQMNRDTDALEQVLLERRNAAVTPKTFADAVAALERRYGAPTFLCGAPKPDPLLAEWVWRFPTTTIHALVLDFRTTAVFTRDPNVDRDVQDRRPGLQRNNRNFMPRRLLIRFHPTAREDLVVRADCVPAD